MAEETLDAFVEAFNRRDRAAIQALLAPDATARVLGAPFPEERGSEAIASVSIPYLFDSDLGAAALPVEGNDAVVLRTNHGAGPVDVVICVTPGPAGIVRLEYVTGPHQRKRMRSIGASLQLPTTADW